MLVGITILLVFQLIGEVAAYFLGGFVPGPVIGMAMIAVVLKLTGGVKTLEPAHQRTLETSRSILANLGILFVPAGVGIIQHLDLIRDRGFALLAIVLLSTVITLTVTVWVFILVKRLSGGYADE
ncbi:CidA/LrgA family protein [Shinella curvata]|uniref:CidA/LrgA family protein n=1 Tax=Shinella curvata TaxID=1817964 RepID=A0ABT8XIA5_9HYPH|nr:CidA/LrgA family protein [Shinella curvata]MCJ8055920.1 CidA/LrgA family protein [Shinella curvata]MDO6123479.1 CidA/LrgA family protein [Shinella curvata]